MSLACDRSYLKGFVGGGEGGGKGERGEGGKGLGWRPLLVCVREEFLVLALSLYVLTQRPSGVS